MQLVKLRPMTQNDRAFVIDSWLESYWRARAYKYGIARPQYKSGQAERIEAALFRSSVEVLEEPDSHLIIGYIVRESLILHWVYVRSSFRRLGIASGLVRDRCSWYTHDSNAIGRKFIEKFKLKYNPYWA